MRQNRRETRNSLCSVKGMTAVELLLVISLIAILAGMAMPTFVQWRQSLEYREAASSIVGALKNARNRAVTTNRQHRVEFNIAAGNYRLTRGNRPDASTDPWNPEGRPWIALPEAVRLNSGAVVLTAIQFNSSGMASFVPLGAVGTVTIRNTAGANLYWVGVEQTGRIRMDRGR